MEKIFFIGFNKTGTSSIAKSLEMAGYTHVIHDDVWTDWSFAKNTQELDKYSVFTDGECAHIATLDALYPNAKFIFNTRNLNDWLDSRYKSVERSRLIAEYFLTSYLPLGFIMRIINVLFLNNSDKAILRWIEIRETYHAFVKNYFKNRPNDFIELDIKDGDSINKLKEFLALDDSFALAHVNAGGTNLRTGRLMHALKLELNEVAVKDKITELVNKRKQQKTSLLNENKLEFSFNKDSVRFRLLLLFVGLRSRTKSVFGKFLVDFFISIFRSKRNMNYYTSIRRFGSASY